MWVWTNLSTIAATIRPLPSHSEFLPWLFVVHLFSCLQPLTATDPSTVSKVLLFPECHRVGIIQYVTFPGWLFSLSNVH